MIHRLLIIMASALLSGAFVYAYAPKERTQIPDVRSQTQQTELLTSDIKVLTSLQTSRFINPSIVDRAIATAQTNPLASCAHARAGIVSHHDLAPELIANFFVTLARCRGDIETFVILAPDHFHLLDRPWARLDTGSTILEREHGVGILIPFVAKLFPEADVIPFVVDQRVSSDSLDDLERELARLLENDRTFIVVSADMSHYLDERRAMSDDRQTLQALETGDATFFWNANDDYTDSGKSIGAVLTVLDSVEWTLLEHRISTEFGGSPGYTTSYITGFLEREVESNESVRR